MNIFKRFARLVRPTLEDSSHRYTYQKLNDWKKDSYLTGDKVEGYENPLWREKRVCSCCDKRRVCMTTMPYENVSVCFTCSRELIGLSRPTFNKYVDVGDGYYG